MCKKLNKESWHQNLCIHISYYFGKLYTYLKDIPFVQPLGSLKFLLGAWLVSKHTFPKPLWNWETTFHFLRNQRLAAHISGLSTLWGKGEACWFERQVGPDTWGSSSGAQGYHLWERPALLTHALGQRSTQKTLHSENRAQSPPAERNKK